MSDTQHDTSITASMSDELEAALSAFNRKHPKVEVLVVAKLPCGCLASSFYGRPNVVGVEVGREWCDRLSRTPRA